jgi:hypothetical protein
MPTDLRRRDDIAAAVAAHNRDDRQRLLLPPAAARLLAIMFPKNTVFQRSLGNLVAAGFDRRTLIKLLGLVETGFLSKEAGGRGIVGTYRLHLLPVQR